MTQLSPVKLNRLAHFLYVGELDLLEMVESSRELKVSWQCVMWLQFRRKKYWLEVFLLALRVINKRLAVLHSLSAVFHVYYCYCYVLGFCCFVFYFKELVLFVSYGNEELVLKL